MRRPVALLLALVLGVLAGPAAAQAEGQTAEIAGTVRSADTGETLPGVCVVAHDRDAEVAVAVASTGEAGSYVFAGLPAGTYLVQFNGCLLPAPGVAYEWWPQAASSEEAVPIELEPGARADAIDASLPAAAFLSGTLTEDGSGEALGDVCALAVEVATAGLAVTFSDVAGDYVLTNLRSGEYLLLFVDCAPPYVHVTELYDDLSFDDLIEGAGELVSVPVVAGEEATGIDAGLELGGAITGVVRGAHHGREQPFVCVGARSEESLEGGGISSETSVLSGFGPLVLVGGALGGEYILGGLPAGTYAVEFSGSSCEDDGYVGQFHLGTDLAGAELIDVSPGTTVADVNANLLPNPSTAWVCGDEQEDGFTDVPGNSPHEATIDCAVALGLVAGRADGTFGPAEQLTRGQVATLLARAIALLGGDLPASPADQFGDDEGSVHELALNQLASVGIIRGDGDGRVRPETKISRDQLATLFVETYEHVLGFKLGWVGDSFSDDNGNAHEREVNRAATAGFVTARESGAYAPAGVVLRDETATALVRLVDRLSRDELSGSSREPIITASTSTASFERTVAAPSLVPAELVRVLRNASR